MLNVTVSLSRMISNIQKYYCKKLIKTLYIYEVVASRLKKPLVLIHVLIHPQQVCNTIHYLIFCDMIPSDSSYSAEDYRKLMMTVGKEMKLL